MANTRSGGAARDEAPETASTSAGTRIAKAGPGSSSSPANARETRSSSAREAQQPNLRRSARETKGKNKLYNVASPAQATATSQKSAKGSREATPVSSVKKTKGAPDPAGSTGTERKSRLKNGATPSPSPASKGDANGSSTPAAASKVTAKRKSDVQNSKKDAGTLSGLSKKQKRLNTKSYRALFNATEENAKSPVVATPIEDEENASRVCVANNDSVSVSKETDAQLKLELSNVAAEKALEGSSSDLHQMPGVILKRDELQIGSHQSDLISESHVPIEICALNKAVESIPTVETGEAAAGDSNQVSPPELPNRPYPPAHHEEANKAIKDGGSVGVQGTCTSSQTEETQCHEAGLSDYVCVVCKKGELHDVMKSCDGKGCRQHCHISCMDPPFLSLGTWLCIICAKKRIQFGVYSVSEGIESLWDVKEGAHNIKQYFVKYKNLAHVHNRWVSESDIVGTPQGRDLVSKFIKRIYKEKAVRWKQEWAEPHRLLKKRSLMPPKEAEGLFNSLSDKSAYCNVEWLVKWKDLGYEHMTWELETSSFLCTPEAEELKRSYENRCEAAKRASDLVKGDKVKKGVFQKLQRLPNGCPNGIDGDHLSSLNQLREFWHSSRGAIFIDDQERVIKTILFVMSIMSDICRPLLIVSTSASLSLWEAKFNRLAASINVVVYNGEKGVRKSIQDLEFYENGSMMLQVLLSHPDAISEDIEAMKCINWEAVIVDDCQNSRVSKCLELLKRLPTNFRMVLLSSPLKENINEYINLLSFLHAEENDIPTISYGDSSDSGPTLAVLKEKLAHDVAFERKADSSKFLEYWVPAHLSTVQLEMYCSLLLSNSPALRSHSKTDSVGVLRDILVSLRKCCDHPYLVDQTLQNSLTKDRPVTDMLDIGVHSSGKLLLLDKMLQKIRAEGLRALILSQSGGGSGNPMGDILDDFVRQRFGYESYERVERGLILPKKQAALNTFNDKTKGRFIFLIDSRACLPSIKLSSVDVIIMYGSDWNPVNDLRALQRISIESPHEHVPVFRLYSSCTVEEKALILARNDHTLDSNIQNINPSLSHCLLSWGASYLFNRLEDFHSSKGSDGDKLFLDNVVLQFLSKLSTKVELSTKVDNTAISEAHLCGSSYSGDIVVLGEREGIPSLDGDLPKILSYWSNLLAGRSPCWQHISEPAQRSRRKIQNTEQLSKNADEPLKVPGEETTEGRMKRRKIGEIMDSSMEVPPGKNKDSMLSERKTPSSSHQISVDDTWQELDRSNLHSSQKGLQFQLKSDLSKLYKLLELPESVKSLCEEFLEYILKNHQVSQEPKGLLHAFKIALCWRAASLLKHKVNRTESLALAVNNLNYECNEGLADLVYEKLRILKKKFAHRAGEISKQIQSISVRNTSPYELGTSTKSRNDESIRSQPAAVDGDLGNGSHQEVPNAFWTEEMVSGERELLSDPGTCGDRHLSRDGLLSRITDKRIKLVDKVFSLRLKSIQEKHSNEVSLLDMHKKRQVAKLRETCNIVVEHFRRNQSHDQEDRAGKIKLVIEWFTMLLYSFLEHMTCQRNKLDTQQSAAWTKESQLKEDFLQAAKSGQLDHTFDQNIPLPDLGFIMEEFSHFREEVWSYHVHAASLAPHSSDDNSAMEITLVRSVNASEATTAEEVRNEPAEVLMQGPASGVVSLSVNSVPIISDGISSQGDASLAIQHSSSSSSSLADNLANQDSSGGGRNDLVEGESIVVSPLQGGTTQLLSDPEVEVNPENSGTAFADPPCLDAPELIAPFSQASLPVSGEVETQTHPVSQTAQLSLAPSQSSQREPEQAGFSGVSAAQPLQFERQQSIPVSSGPLEGLYGISAAPALQSERQQSVPLFNNPLERAQPDQSPTHLTDGAPGFAQSAELFPAAPLMSNHPPIDNEPLKNELNKLRLHMDTLSKMHELKKTQLQTECSQEIEKIKRKYELLMKEQDSNLLQHRKTINDICAKVLINQSLAEDFRAKFISPTPAQAAKAHAPQVRGTPQASQQLQMRLPVSGPSAHPVAPSSASRPPVPRPRIQPAQVDRTSSSLLHVSRSSSSTLQVGQPAPLIPGNLPRSTSAPVSHMIPPRGSHGVQSELATRAPAPHLQFKLPRSHSHSTSTGNQQQLPSRLEASSSRTQLAPVTQATSSLLSSQATPLANSSPATSAGSSPVVTSLPSSSYPILPASLLPPILSPAFQGTAPRSLNTSTSDVWSGTVASNSVGPSISAVMQQANSRSLSLDAWLTKNLGLGSDPPSVGAPTNGGTNVVCLSDDESD
ncbi:hypothetical protein ACP4OV_022778 [Aristida adscensionis]